MITVLSNAGLLCLKKAQYQCFDRLSPNYRYWRHWRLSVVTTHSQCKFEAILLESNPISRNPQTSTNALRTNGKKVLTEKRSPANKGPPIVATDSTEDITPRTSPLLWSPA